jgi:hypothetical protein
MIRKDDHLKLFSRQRAGYALFDHEGIYKNV